MNVIQGCTCCGAGCEICTASGCGYTVTAGSATITGSEINVTASSTIVLSNTDDSSGGTAVEATVLFTAATSGDQARLIIKYKDASNYWFAEVQAGSSGYLRTYWRTGGVNLLRGSIAAVVEIATQYELKVCYGNGGVAGTVGIPSLEQPLYRVSTVETTSITDGPKAGVGSSSVTSSIVFDQLAYDYGLETTLHDDCKECYRSCNFASDDFNRADSGSLGSAWNVETGSWSIASNRLLASSASAIVTSTSVASLGSSSGMTVRVTTPSSPSNPIRLYLNWVNSSNHYYAEFDGYTSQRITIVEVSGGTPTTLANADYNAGTFSEFTFCYQAASSRLVASTVFTGVIPAYLVAVDIPTPTSTVCGIGTSPSNSSQSFDNFTIKYNSGNNCPYCEACVPCELPNVGIPRIQVAISGMANGTCGNCATLDGTYVLEHQGFGAGNGFGVQQTCYWMYEFPSTTCGAAGVGFKYLTVGYERVSLLWRAILWNKTTTNSTSASNANAQWDYVADPNCHSGTYAATFYSDSAECDASGSTATITIPAP